jgi:hypothetical protein
VSLLARSARGRMIGSPTVPRTVSPIGFPLESPGFVVRDETLQLQPLFFPPLTLSQPEGEWSCPPLSLPRSLLL